MILMCCLLGTLTIAAYAILLAKKAGNYSVERLSRYLGGARMTTATLWGYPVMGT
jgi:hypothetical protein